MIFVALTLFLAEHKLLVVFVEVVKQLTRTLDMLNRPFRVHNVEAGNKLIADIEAAENKLAKEKTK